MIIEVSLGTAREPFFIYLLISCPRHILSAQLEELRNRGPRNNNFSKVHLQFFLGIFKFKIVVLLVIHTKKTIQYCVKIDSQTFYLKENYL